MIHGTHVPAPPKAIGKSTGLVYCEACGALLSSDRGEAVNSRVEMPCRPVRVGPR